MDQAAILAETSAVHRKNARARLDLVNPDLDFRGSCRVRPAGDLDFSLEFTDRNRREAYLLGLEMRDPGEHAAMGFPFARLGDDVDIEKKASHRIEPPVAGSLASFVGDGESKSADSR